MDILDLEAAATYYDQLVTGQTAFQKAQSYVNQFGLPDVVIDRILMRYANSLDPIELVAADYIEKFSSC